MAIRIFQLCVVFAVVEIFHHAYSTTSTSDNDNLIKPPPCRLTVLPTPLAPPPTILAVNTLWAARNTHVDIPCLVQWSEITAATTTIDDNIERGPDVRWLHDGKRVLGDGGTETETEGKLGVVVTSGAEGKYECVVEYGGGDGAVVSNPIQLRIASMHEFTIQPEEAIAEEGQPAVFFCNVNSNPPADITWQRNSVAISTALSPDSYVVLPTGALLIKNVHSNNVGNYRCRAMNSILNKPRMSKRAKLRLQPKTSAMSDAAILATALETNKTTIYGETVDLHCFARGNPEPNIQWYKDGIIVGNSNILKIFNVTENHSGNYKCMAANNISTSYQYYTMNVLRAPFFNVTPESMSFPSAKTVRLHCEANGNPKPKIFWLKNGRKLDYDGRVKLLQNTLVLSHSFSTDAGIYQCVAENSVGRTWSAARLSITMPFGQPQPPQNVTCRQFEANSICVQWRAPHGLNASAYSVHTTDMETTKMLTEQVTNDTVMVVRQLRPNSTYAFYVRGYVRSASDQSRSVQCTTLPQLAATTSVLRRRFTVAPINESSVWLTWDELSNDVPCTSTTSVGAEDMWYRVQWRHVSSTPSIYHTTSVLGRRYHLSSLIPSTSNYPSRYRFHVSPLSAPPNIISNAISNTTSLTTPANNIKHPAFEYTVPTDSNPKVTTIIVFDEAELLLQEKNVEESLDLDEDVFQPPHGLSAELAGHDSVRLMWEDDNVDVAFYTVCYGVIGVDADGCGGAGGKRQEFKKCTTKSIQVNNLHQNTLYQFRVRAHAKDDITSAYSEPIQLNTMDLLSSAVQNLDYFIINASCVCVTWQQPPYLQNSSYTNYTVAYAVKQKKSEDGWHYITVTSGPGIKQHSCYRSDDSTTLLPFGNPIAAKRSSEMSLLLSELKPNLNYSLYVQSPGSNPGLTITITTNSAIATNTIQKEEDNNDEEDLAELERADQTHSQQIMGVIVGVCVSVPLLLAVICWFIIWPQWRRRRDERRRRCQNMSHLNGGTDTSALTAKTRSQPNHNSASQALSTTPYRQQQQYRITNNNGCTAATVQTSPYGNGVGMRSLLQHPQHGRSSESNDDEDEDCGDRGADVTASTAIVGDGDVEGEAVELLRLLGPTLERAEDAEERSRNSVEENRRSAPKNGPLGCSIHITENPQYTSNGVYTTVSDAINSALPADTPTPINNGTTNNNTTSCRRQQPDITSTTSQNIQLLPRRQSPALAPNG